MRTHVLVVAVGVSLGGAPIASAQLEPASRARGAEIGSAVLATGVLGGAVGGAGVGPCELAASVGVAAPPRLGVGKRRRAEVAFNLCDAGCPRPDDRAGEGDDDGDRPAPTPTPRAAAAARQRASVIAPVVLQAPRSTEAGLATGGRL